MQTALTTPQTTASLPQNPSPYNPLGILSTPDPSKPPYSFHPPSHIAIRLWNSFAECVDNCTGLKLLHIPTDEIKVFSVVQHPQSASLEDLSLCFAVYFAASVSMTEPELEAILYPSDRVATLLSFKTGFEQSLAHADFLDSPTFTTFQALAVYLVSPLLSINCLRRKPIN